MTIFLSLALRNMFRNKKRSLITLSAVTFGLAALIFLRGFVFGAQAQMVENITTSLTSDAQIVPKSLENIYNTNGYIEDPEAIRAMPSRPPIADSTRIGSPAKASPTNCRTAGSSSICRSVVA